MHSEDLLSKNKRVLLEKRNELIEEIGLLRKEIEGNGHENGDDIGDDANHSEEKDKLCRKIQRNKKRITLVDKALLEIENGTYGTCFVCKKEIGDERLGAIIDTVVCKKCANTARSV